MIRALVDFALNNKFVVLAVALLLIGWGAISFHDLPVEAYPDIADNYVTVITQWAGRSAEEVEQQVTIPIEIQMAGVPHMTYLRSESIFGLSFVIMIFDDTSINDWNRQKVLERLTQVNLPSGQNLQPQIGTDWSTTGQIYWYTVRSSNPKYDLMELRSLEDWVLLKQFKSVPNVVDVSDFGGMVREYQVRVEPSKLVSYGLSIGQVEQQLAVNNINAGGSFVEVGLQQMNVRALGLFSRAQDIEQTVLKTQTGTALRVKDIAEVTQGPKIRLGHMARANHMEDGRIIDEPDVIQGAVLMRKGAEEQPTLDAIHKKVDELNHGILPPGVTVVPMLDRSDLLRFTLNTVLHNLVEGMLLVSVVLFLFLLNARAALIVALTIPFSLLFASIWLDLSHIPANLLSLGALDFGMVVDGAVVMVENIIRHLSRSHHEAATERQKTTAEKIREACHEVQRPVFYAIAIIITAYMPIFTLQRVEGRLFRPMAWTVVFALLGAMTFSILVAPVLAATFFPRGVRERRNVVMDHLTQSYRRLLRWAVHHRWVVAAIGAAALAGTIYLGFGGVIGAEFLPHLDEGAVWARGTLANSTSLSEGEKFTTNERYVFASFPEVKTVVSEVGRPDDGTDTGGFGNTEYFVDLKPKEQWRPVFHRDKQELIAAMNRAVAKYPGAIWNFSQPIEDNVGESLTGTKGALAVKIFGDDLKLLEQKGEEVTAVMSGISGMHDVKLLRDFGQPNLDITIDRRQAARFGINVADIQDAVQTAVGGTAVSQVLIGEQRYDVVVRYQTPYRNTQRAIERVRPDGRAGVPGATSEGRSQGRGVRHLPRGQQPLRGRDLQRERPRPGDHGRRGNQAD
jgi:cobalt-zinc-cadmium resistance protein CzcA